MFAVTGDLIDALELTVRGADGRTPTATPRAPSCGSN